MSQRVVSKNLFNYKPAGQLDDDVQAMETKYEAMMEMPEVKAVIERQKELEHKDDEESLMEYLKIFRSGMEGMMQQFVGNPAYSDGLEQTIATSFTVPTTHDGTFDVPVEVYTPKDLEGDTKKAAYIYAHGGGAVALSATHSEAPLRTLAQIGNVVVFNVDYRIAPETKCPNNITDFYMVIKYVSENAESLGVDPAKICIAGDSGGGYICLGAMVLLAQHDETHLVKLAIPGVPMVDDYCFSDPLPMTIEERKAHISLRKLWKDFIAADYEKQKNDPRLFPGKASEELLAKFPPTIIMECEFDIFITEATRLANRLRRAGRLLELVVIPGARHGNCMVPGLKCTELFEDTMKSIAREYIHN